MPQNWLLNRTVPPTVEPVTLAELKNHARVLNTDAGQDHVLNMAIATARDQFELLTDVAIMEQTWQLQLPTLPPDLRIPKPPMVDAGSVSVAYVDTDGNTQPFTDWTVMPSGYSNARLIAPGAIPSTSSLEPFPWSVTYKAGQVDPTDVWSAVRGAILLLAAYFYEHRITAVQGQVTELPHAFQSVVAQYRVYWP